MMILSNGFDWVGFDFTLFYCYNWAFVFLWMLDPFCCVGSFCTPFC
jgi:hypothetical protein